MESRRVENWVSVVTEGAAASAGINCVLGESRIEWSLSTASIIG